MPTCRRYPADPPPPPSPGPSQKCRKWKRMVANPSPTPCKWKRKKNGCQLPRRPPVSGKEWSLADPVSGKEWLPTPSPTPYIWLFSGWVPIGFPPSFIVSAFFSSNEMFIYIVWGKKYWSTIERKRPLPIDIILGIAFVTAIS